MMHFIKRMLLVAGLACVSYSVLAQGFFYTTWMLPPSNGCSNFSTWSTTDKAAAILLSGCNLVATDPSSATAGVRGTKSHNSGKWYFEITKDTDLGSLTYIGFATAGQVLTAANSTNAFCCLPNPSNSIWYHNSFPFACDSFGGAASFALDLTANLAWYALGCGIWNNNGAANPATGIGGFDISVVFAGNPAFPYVLFDVNALTIALNVGASPFGCTVPAGFSPWGFLFKRDIMPAANDNRPMFLESVA